MRWQRSQPTKHPVCVYVVSARPSMDEALSDQPLCLAEQIPLAHARCLAHCDGIPLFFPEFLEKNRQRTTPRGSYGDVIKHVEHDLLWTSSFEWAKHCTILSTERGVIISLSTCYLLAVLEKIQDLNSHVCPFFLLAQTETDRQTDRQQSCKMVQSQKLSSRPEGMSERVMTAAKKSLLLIWSCAVGMGVCHVQTVKSTMW